ncbi:MAG: cyclic pyranopterin phosphate synthase MoaA [Gammaproteobacteria bacterium RBG_16_57_12]|nr:MAG: cyclic pyranopterin phosphate synthase MoaA [Gammaproteobacteria bacterium RBG_16_57_12]
MATQAGNASKPALIDPHGRRIDYIRLSVTDKCNLRCFYCLPEGYKDFTEPSSWLSFDEIERVIRAFADLGVRRVRITGGEPLVRKNLSALVAQLNAIDTIDDLSLSTNASLLRRDAPALKQAGIARINVSLDTLLGDRFAQITRNGQLATVLDGLMAAKAAGLTPIKINMVVMKDVNDDETEDMVLFCLEHGFTLRFIETMPMGDSGRSASLQYLDLDIVRKHLAGRFDLIDSVMPGGGPARYMNVKGTDLHIGFITPISQHFCDTCNRVRLSADGTLYLCMGNEHSFALRPLLREGISDDDLKHALLRALALKPRQHDFNSQPGKIVRVMARLGG